MTIAALMITNSIISAKWIPNKFAVEFTVKSSETINDLKRSIESTSLADGQHESISDSGWVIATPNHSVIGYVSFDIHRVSVVKVK